MTVFDDLEAGQDRLADILAGLSIAACGDLGRLQAAMPDIDELVRNITVEPL